MKRSPRSAPADLAASLAITALLVGCANVPEASGTARAELTTNAERATFFPKETHEAFRNPGKGWLMYDFEPMTNPGRATATDVASSVYTNFISWGDVEPYEGVYRWFLIDRLLSAYPDRKIRISITLLDPTSRPWYGATGEGQFPTWLSQKLCPTGLDCRGRWSNTFYGMRLDAPAYVAQTKADAASALFEPHYWDPYFLERHESFVRALARRHFHNDETTAGYAGAPDWSERIESFDMGTYGVWGEWHSDISWPDADVKRTTLQAMARHYHDAFTAGARATNKPVPEIEQSIVGSSVTGSDVYADGDSTAIRYSVETLGSTMVRKFLGADPSIFFQPDEARLASENASRRPFRLEWGSCSGDLTPAAFACLGGTPDTLDRALDRALSLNASLVGWYADPASLSATKVGTSDTLEAFFQKNAGFRFFVERVAYPRAVARGEFLTIDSSWYNRARGKCYRKYGLRAFLAQGTQVIPLDSSSALAVETWPLGVGGPYPVTATFSIPVVLAPGTYELQLAVVDHVGQPAMNLAISGKLAASAAGYGRYAIGSIDIR